MMRVLNQEQAEPVPNYDFVQLCITCSEVTPGQWWNLGGCAWTKRLFPGALLLSRY